MLPNLPIFGNTKDSILTRKKSYMLPCYQCYQE